MKRTCVYFEKELHHKNANFLFTAKVTAKNDCVIRFLVAAADLYKFYINGESVFYGPSRTARGYCVENCFSYPVKKGENDISVILTSYGVATYYIIKKEPFFSVSFELDGKKYDQNDFSAYELKERVVNVQRFSFQRGFAEIYRQSADFKRLYAEYYEKGNKLSLKTGSTPEVIKEVVPVFPLDRAIDGRSVSQGKVSIDENKAVWEDRSIFQVGNNFEGYPYEGLSECLTDMVCRFTYEKTPDFDDLTDLSYKLYDFGRDVSGFIRLDVSVARDTEIYAVFDEILKDGDVSPVRNFCCNVIKWYLKKGDYVLEAFEINTLRYLKLICFKGLLTVNKVQVKLAENPSAYNTKVTTDDKIVNDIFSAAANTLAQNSFDLITDCPSRERAGWINDLYYSMCSASLLSCTFDVVDATIMSMALYEDNGQVPKGMIPMCYPADHIDGQFLPNCALWYVFGLIRRADSPLLKAYADKIKKQIEGVFAYFEKFENEYCLLENVEGWVFVEWSKANDPEFVKGVNYPSNMLYYKALKDAGEYYGNEKYKLKAEKIKAAILSQSFNGEFFEDNRVRSGGKLVRTGNISEACQYFAFFSGIADVKTHKRLYDVLLNEFGVFRDKEKTYPEIDRANIITGLLMRADLLNEQGEFDAVINETKAIFGSMAETTSTLWEHTGDFASCNHCIASYAAAILFKSLIGVTGITGDGLILSDGFSQKIDVTATFDLGKKKIEVKKEKGKRTVREY